MNYREELKAGGITTANKLEKMASVVDNQKNADYLELVKTIKRARFDSLLGLSNNFLIPQREDEQVNEQEGAGEEEEVNEEGELIEKPSLRRMEKCSADFKIFDLSYKRYKLSNLREVLALSDIV